MNETNGMSDNPLKELLERAGNTGPDLLHPGGSPDRNNPKIVLTQDDDEDDDAPITLGVRQPSYSSLHGVIIPKGGTGAPPSVEPVKEENVGLGGMRQSSYANLHLQNVIAAEKHVDDNPLIVATNEDDEDDDGPITLNVRQPSFASLQGHLRLKGENEDMTMMDVPVEDAQEEQQTKLGVRQSSYARLHLANVAAQPVQPKILPQVVEEKPENPENPVMVFTKDGEDEDDDQPIGLSVRQPSFSSLRGMVVPKGGVESLQGIEPVIEEEAGEKEKEKEPRLGPRQSSYAHLHMNVSPVKQTQALPTLEEVAKVEVDANPVVVCTNDDDEDDDQPIGLSVRQPSYSSLHGVLIPKGGIEAVVQPIIEEEPIIEEKDEEKKLGHHARQSSYSNLRMMYHVEAAPKPDVPQTIQEVQDQNPVIVMTKEGEDEDDGAPIQLNVRQPSYSSLHGVMIPKGSVAGTLPELIEEEPETKPAPVLAPTPAPAPAPALEAKPQDGTALDEFDDEMKKSVLSSLHEFNLAKWKEMGYEPNAMKRNCSCQMFHVEDRILTRPSNLNQNRNMSYMFGGLQGLQGATAPKNTGANRPQKIKRVNSAGGNNDPLPQVEMPISEKEAKPVPARPMDRGPSLVRVNSSGNMSRELIVEMPIVEEEKKPTQEETEDDIEAADDEASEEDVADECRIPPRLQQLIHHPKESVVYLALCGACITGYHDKTIAYVITELKKYEKECSKHGYTNEANYVRNIINQVTASAAEMQSPKKKTSPSKSVTTDKTILRKTSGIESARDKALRELDERYAQQGQDLDDEWNSEAMRCKFNKPSPALVAMRRAAQKMAKEDKLEENSILRQKIAEKEDEESAAATQKMEQAYAAAVSELKAQYERERRKIMRYYDDQQQEVNSFARKREQCLAPIQKRVARLSATQQPVARGNRKLYHTHDPKGLQGQRPVHLGSEKLALPRLNKLKNESLV